MPIQTEAQKQGNRSENSDIYVGTVVSCDPGTMVMEVVPQGAGHSSRTAGIPLSHVFSSALGFKETLLYPVGTRVVCCNLGESKFTYIVGAIPPSDAQGDGGINSGSVAISGKIGLNSDDPLTNDTHKLPYLNEVTRLNTINNGLPTDVIQGEKVIANEFGVLMGLFQLVGMLRASDLAQVQCHFLDDLVRIVSHNFQHYTSLGELNVTHDGKAINLEVGATHDPFESIGIPSINTAGTSTISQVNNIPVDAQDPTKSNNQFYQLSKNARALERLKLFVGKLGGFINLLLCLPSSTGILNTDGTLNTKGEPDAGLLQVKANLDGSLIVRSVNGIYLEKTDWIRVPQRLLASDDPTGDDGTAVDYPVKAAYKFDDTYTYRDTAFLYYLQLRDYLAYTDEELGYTDFQTLKKDFFVNNDVSKNPLVTNPALQAQNTFVDPSTSTTFKRTRSVFALMPNGGIAMADHWGSCIAMEGGNIYIQPAKDLIVQANRDVVAKVGRNITVSNQNEIDISSTSGSLRCKTAGAQTYYSDNSGILLHANGPAVSPEVLTFKNSSSITGITGVVMYAPNSGVTGWGQQIYMNGTNNSVFAGKINVLYSDEDIEIRSKGQVGVYSNNLVSVTTDETVLYSNNSMVALGMGSTILGKSKQVIGVTQTGVVTGLLDPSSAANQSFMDDLNQQSISVQQFDVKVRLAAYKDSTELTTILFQFPPYEINKTTDGQLNLTASDVLPLTYSQQQAIVSNSLNNSWIEVPVNNSYPYPGGSKNNPNKTFVSTPSNNVQLIGNELVNIVKPDGTTTTHESVFSSLSSPFGQSSNPFKQLLNT